MKQIRSLFLSKMTQVGTPIALFSSFLLSSCGPVGDLSDKMLFGVTLDSQAARGAPEVSITSPSGHYMVSEFYGTLELNAALSIAPTSDITFTVNSSNTNEQTVTPATITFTPENWSLPQTITITGVDEYVVDGNKETQVVYGSVQSDDALFAGKAIPSTAVTVVDNETFSIIVSPRSLTTTESGTISGYTNTADFYVALSTQPTANVIIPSFAISDNTEGVTPVSPSSLTFTPVNWSTPQKVTVTGQDDALEDGPVKYTITPAPATSTMAGYNNLQGASISVTNLDDDAPISVTPLEVNLIEAPSGDCGNWGECSKTISITVNQISSCEGNLKVTPSVTPADSRVQFSPTELTFTGNGTQNITVTIENNVVEDQKGPFTISFAVDDLGGTACDNKPLGPVALNIEDDEGPGVRVSKVSRETRENIPQDATFQVMLTKAPAAGTTVTVPINDVYDINNYQNNEGYVNKATLIFTPANWNTPQTVTITPVNDYIDDDDIQYIIAVEPVVSADADYNGIDPRDVTANNFNEDTSGVIVLANGVETKYESASGSTINGFATDDSNVMGSEYASWQIKLQSKPTANVTVTFNGGNTTVGTHTDGLLSVASLVFTPNNWDTFQTVSVTGDSNNANEGNHDFTIGTTYSSTDSKYAALGRPTFSIHSCDNDVDNWVVDCRKSGGGGLDSSTSETGDTGYVTFITQSASCTGGVSFAVSGGDTDEGAVTTNPVIDSSNYNLIAGGSNRVIVTGQNDSIDDGNKTFTIGSATCTGCLAVNGVSSACKVKSPDPLSYTFTNVDNENQWTTRTDGNTTESGGTGQVCLRLGSQPASGITVDVTCSDATECDSVSPTSLSFTTADYYTEDTPTCNGTCEKCVTVTGKDDDIADQAQNITVTFKVITGDGDVFGVNEQTSRTISNHDNENTPKRVWVTTTPRNGEISPGVAVADAYCNGSDAARPSSGTYKALIVDRAGGVRSSGKDVLTADTQYYNYATDPSGIASSGDVLFRTDASRQIDGDFNGTYGGFDSESLNLSNGSYWTGMARSSLGIMSGFTASPNNNCDDWSMVDDPSHTVPYYGGSWTISGGNVSENWELCTQTRRLICVEQ